MNEETFQRRYEQLLTVVVNHPHKEELIAIMQEQVLDDELL